MKTKSFLVFVPAVLFLFLSASVFSQTDCPMSELYPSVAASLSVEGGLYKPHRTDLSEGSAAPSEARLNIIMVFTSFPDDDAAENWPQHSAPNYMNNLLALSKSPSGNFWDRYSSSTEMVSDYYQELSLGKLHVTGITRFYEFQHNRSYYYTNPAPYVAEGIMNEELYEWLKTDNTIVWSDYDLWKQVSEGNFKYAPLATGQNDHNIDMLMMIRKYNPGVIDINHPEYRRHAGIAGLDSPDKKIDVNNNLWIRNSYDGNGSGLVVQGNFASGPIGFSRLFGEIIHEYGHFLWGFHSSTGTMTSKGGISINDFYGSPFEKIKLGYLAPDVITTFPAVNKTLGDISNRSSNNQILKVPISSSEYFLVTNRRKVSIYDVPMLGDTTNLSPYKNTGSMGAGVYIYHGRDNSWYPQDQDDECADGIWDWEVSGTTTPDWSTSQNIPILKRSGIPSPVLNDENPPFDQVYTLLDNKDGISGRYNQGGAWFSLGKRHTTLGELGTDKIYTNYPDWWTSREWFGDRFDAWNLGYNELFSPYSNPNTNDWNNSNTGTNGYGTGIFIYYKSLSGTTANFDIYKATDQTSLNSILASTPPSKPMILDIEEYFDGTTCHPKIVWRQNTEPDMRRNGETKETEEVVYKRYKIYKSHKPWEGVLPNDQQFYPENKYTCIATIDVAPNTLDASYVDNSVNLFSCSYYNTMPYGTSYPVRYRVQAVDNTNWGSVLSDLRQTHGIDTEEGEPIDPPEGRPGHLTENEPENLMPSKYNLYQNYPNPFNPVTNIQFDLPKDEFVTIKIYDIVGKEVAVLVNNFRQAGSHLVSFDGSKLGSGIYFYRIETRDFLQTKRMILMK